MVQTSKVTRVIEKYKKRNAKPVCFGTNSTPWIGGSAWTGHWNHAEGILEFQMTSLNVSTAMFTTQSLN